MALIGMQLFVVFNIITFSLLFHTQVTAPRFCEYKYILIIKQTAASVYLNIQLN